MGRRIIKPGDVDSTNPNLSGGVLERGFEVNSAMEKTVPDSYTDRLIKYIPSEIVAAFISMNGIVQSMAAKPDWIDWAIFILLLVITPLYIWRVTTPKGEPAPMGQIAISTLSYVVWVFALGGPFIALSWYQSVYGALILPLYTLIVPIIDN